MDQQQLRESQLFFDMSRMNRKKNKERGEKDVLEEIFLGNATCTSVEMHSQLCKKEQNSMANAEEEEGSSIKAIARLKEIDQIFNEKLEALRELNQRIDNNLEKISFQFKNESFKSKKGK